MAGTWPSVRTLPLPLIIVMIILAFLLTCCLGLFKMRKKKSISKWLNIKNRGQASHPEPPILVITEED
jgi:hypothetical protein